MEIKSSTVGYWPSKVCWSVVLYSSVDSESQFQFVIVSVWWWPVLPRLVLSCLIYIYTFVHHLLFTASFSPHLFILKNRNNICNLVMTGPWLHAHLSNIYFQHVALASKKLWEGRSRLHNIAFVGGTKAHVCIYYTHSSRNLRKK